jgi:ABC-type lipoprotein release transport system permease subunit
VIARQWWIDVRARMAALFGRRRLYARADEELEFHLSRLYEMSATDPVVYASVTGLVALTAITAIAVPAWRVATVDPVMALRDE